MSIKENRKPNSSQMVVDEKAVLEQDYLNTSEKDIISAQRPNVYDSTIEDQSSLLKKLLLELSDPRTTPKMVLQALSSPCFIPTSYKSEEDNESIVIFLACIEFIMKMLPDGYIIGIWEEVLRKTVNLSSGVKDDFHQVIHALFGLGRVSQVETWLCKALNTDFMCPNPYIRLELFRLVRLFKAFDHITTWERVFIHTISEIQPHHLYPSGNEDDVIFSVEDLIYIINNVLHFDLKLQEIISSNTFRPLKNKKQLIFNSSETKFLINLLQLIGVFAIMAGSMTDHTIQISQLIDCFCLLMPWMQFRHLVSLPKVRCYAIEALRDMTSAVTSFPIRGDIRLRVELEEILLELRDSISMEVSNESSALPILMLSRQIDGHTITHRQSLLLKEFSLGRLNLNSKYDGKGGNECEWLLYNKYCKLRHMSNVFGNKI